MQQHQNILSIHPTCHGSTKDVVTHIRYLTTYAAPTCFTRWCPTFNRYIHTHLLIENKQFLLLIDVPIQDRSQQITIHKVLTLSIPHGNFSACYDINTIYLGITKDATMAVELSTTQFQVCWEANVQFCTITTPFQPLADQPSCVSALYTRSPAYITSQCSLQIRKTSDCKLTNTDISSCLGHHDSTLNTSKNTCWYVLKRPQKPSP